MVAARESDCLSWERLLLSFLQEGSKQVKPLVNQVMKQDVAEIYLEHGLCGEPSSWTAP